MQTDPTNIAVFETVVPRADLQSRRQSVDAALPTPVLRDAARTAGMFQRSVLGHLDHKEWLGRVRADGQKLIDLLTEMGFTPGEGATKPRPVV